MKNCNLLYIHGPHVPNETNDFAGGGCSHAYQDQPDCTL